MGINRIKYVDVMSGTEDTDFVTFEDGGDIVDSIYITENGTYYAPQDSLGYKKVEVNVAFPPAVEFEYTNISIKKKDNQAFVNIPDDKYAIGSFGLAGSYMYVENLAEKSGNTTLSLDNIRYVLYAGMYKMFFWTICDFDTVSMTGLRSNSLYIESMRSAFEQSNIKHFIGSDSNTIELTTMGCAANMFRNSDLQTFDALVSKIGNETDTLDNSVVGETPVGCAYRMFSKTSSLTSVNMSELELISGNKAAQLMFAESAITSISFPKLTGIYNSYAAASMFENSSLSTLNVPKLHTISGYGAAMSMFYRCTSLVRGPLVDLMTIDGDEAARELYAYCSSMADLGFYGLQTVTGNQTLLDAAIYDTSLENAVFFSLHKVTGRQVFQEMFTGCTALTDIYFLAFRSNSVSYASVFYNMCNGLSGVTIHFPSNVQSIIQQTTGYSTTAPYGSVSGTVLFDLPSTQPLVGADGNTYYRNPIYDATGVSAWGLPIDETTNPDIDIYTPFYTSNNPQVGDTIYSDSTLQTAVTTIASI